jgi:hypothetical protein
LNEQKHVAGLRRHLVGGVSLSHLSTELRSCSVNSRRVPWLFSIQLREFAAQSFAILLMHLLGMQELGQKLPRPRSVVAALLKLGNECQLPLDYDLALGYVLLRQGKVIQHHLPIHAPAYDVESSAVSCKKVLSR